MIQSVDSIGKFDEVVSLGYNCEVSFRIENALGELNSMPFSWAYILDRDLFLEALENPKEIFQNEVSVCRDPRVNTMIQCDKYKICFHPRAEYVDADGTIIENTFREACDELRSRVAHLTDKFEKLLQSEKRTLFLVGVTENGKTTDAEFIKKLYQYLCAKYVSKNFLLVAVIPKKRMNKELFSLESDRLKIRTIKRFGTQRCNDISTDASGWSKIFGEFLGKEYKKSFLKNLGKHRRERIFAAIKKRLFSR